MATIGPIAAGTALLFYFGWVRTSVQASELGYDTSIVGFTTQDYILRSINVLAVPVTTLVMLGLLLYLVHRRLLGRSHPRPGGRWAAATRGPSSTLVLGRMDPLGRRSCFSRAHDRTVHRSSGPHRGASLRDLRILAHPPPRADRSAVESPARVPGHRPGAAPLLGHRTPRPCSRRRLRQLHQYGSHTTDRRCRLRHEEPGDQCHPASTNNPSRYRTHCTCTATTVSRLLQRADSQALRGT